MDIHFDTWINCSFSRPHYHHSCPPNDHLQQCYIQPWVPSTSCHAALTPTLLSRRRSHFSWTNLISQNVKRGECREALQIWKQMQKVGLRANTYTFVAVLKACGCLGDLQTGRQIHALVIENGTELQMHVASTLISMYAKCGSIDAAYLVFNRIPNPDMVSWNAMILGYAQRGEGELALQLYEQMEAKGFVPQARTFVGALKACSCLAEQEEEKKVNGKPLKLQSLNKGRIIHSQVAKSGLHTDKFVATSLLDMYAKCGSMEDAYLVFEKMPHPDLVAWNAMILGYAQGGQAELALQLYEQVKAKGFAPDARTFVGALKACTSLAEQEEDKRVHGNFLKLLSLRKGRTIHSQAAKVGLDSDKFVANTLIDVYTKCGSMGDAYLVFERMPHPNVVSWNIMILGYAQRGEGKLAVQLYEQMKVKGFAPEAQTFVGALNACSCLAEQEEGKKVDGKLLKLWPLQKGRIIHSEVIKSGLDTNKFIATSLLDMYAKCGSMEDASLVFDRMLLPDVVSWNAMILGYAQRGEGELGLELYEKMKAKGFAPNARTFVGALKACSCIAEQEEENNDDVKSLKLCSLKKGKIIHSEAAKHGHDSDIFVANTLIDMYAKCGIMEDACMVFERMPHPDIVSWNAIILGYARKGEGELALHWYERMQIKGFAPDARTFIGALKACSFLAAQEEAKVVHGKVVRVSSLSKCRSIHSEASKCRLDSNKYVASTMVNLYAQCGSMPDAHTVFEMMPTRDVVTWAAIILGYAENEQGKLALQLYARFQNEGLMLDARIFVAALKACGSVAALENGKEIHAQICKLRLEGDTILANCLIDMYGKCGSMDDAQQIFDKMPKRDVSSWTTLISGYSRQGESERVFLWFQKMIQEGLKPNGMVFLSLLTGCSHVGNADQGWIYFHAMKADYGITPTIEHYNIMVDLLGRAGQLVDAKEMANKMPAQPNMTTWLTLMGSCQKWKNVEVGRHAFECAVRLDSNLAAPYVLMSNIYAAAGMHEVSHKVQTLRMDAGA